MLNSHPAMVPTDQADLGDMRAHDIALSHLNARGFIQFHPLLAQRLDDFKAAIFLGHALYWSKHLAQIQPQRKGWFFMSAAQWTQATGLSTREQVSIRSALVERGLLLEALAGRPAVMHFKVDLGRTAKLLGQPDLTWASMTELFRSCIRFYKPLVDICGSVGAGLYLSYLLQRQSFAMRNPETSSAAVEMFPGEFVYRPEQARIALCLGSKAQRNAREKLKAAGFIREGRSIQEMVATRVNLAAIASCLQAQGERAIRRSAPRKRSVRVAVHELAVVPSGTNLLGGAALLNRTGTTLPQRQLHLFSPVGLISKWHLDRVANDRLAPQDDAATLVNTRFAASDSPAGLVMSLFAPAGVERTQPPESAAIQHRSLSPGVLAAVPNGPASIELSTDELASVGRNALLSYPIRRFVEPNLPFCRNSKEQGIPRYFQTTTSQSVDNSEHSASRRRRVEKNETERPKATVVHQIDDGGSPQEVGGDPSNAVGIHECKPGKSPASLECPSGQVPRSIGKQATELVLPSRLDASLRAGVLATVTQAPSELRQAFLDELSGHLAIPSKKIHNPAGWLHSLIRRHAEGFVALAMAPQVAEQRVRQRRHQERLAGVVACSTEQQMPTSTQCREVEPAPLDSEIKRTHRQRLLELKAAFTTQRGGR
ncbi:MAG: hypothetical protein WA007_05550 [Hydrogenophaga sp.]